MIIHSNYTVLNTTMFFPVLHMCYGTSLCTMKPMVTLPDIYIDYYFINEVMPTMIQRYVPPLHMYYDHCSTT